VGVSTTSSGHQWIYNVELSFRASLLHISSSA